MLEYDPCWIIIYIQFISPSEIQWQQRIKIPITTPTWMHACLASDLLAATNFSLLKFGYELYLATGF
jgi:hypothetical protein